jgi:hypothetical protein
VKRSTVLWRSRLKLAVQAALPLWIAALFGPAAARASCGDYVLFDSNGKLPSAASFRAIRPIADSSPAQGPYPLQAPCSSFRCSGHSIPLAPPYTMGSVPEDHWAVPAKERFDSEAVSILIHSGASVCRAVHQPASIYHPPR